MLTQRFISVALVAVTLTACGAFQRSDDAAVAKKRMIGMPREQVLACMGPAKKKAVEGATEVWSYLSTDGSTGGSSGTATTTHYAYTSSAHDKTFCTVNIVMRNGIVSAINYNGPTGGLLTKDEQCGYAISNCVAAGSD